MSLLLPETWPFSIDWLPPEACLVGGAVRDTLLQRQSNYLDLDFIVPSEAIIIAKKIAQYYHAGFVVLDEQRQIARVVFPQGTVDFALQEGNSIEADLSRRDFTVNAIAYNPYQQTLIDPLQGLVDLEKKQFKMISAANLQADPLRLLRAYRQAAQLNFTIEPNTQASLRNLAPKLAQVAAERVQSELNYLLADPQGSYWLKKAWLDGLLGVWLKAVTPTKLEQLTKIDTIIPWLTSQWPQIDWRTKVYSLAKLASLVEDKPVEAEAELIALKYPREVFSGVKAVLNYLFKLSNTHVSFSLREQYFFFLRLGKLFPVLAVLALAKGLDTELITMLINRYHNPKDLVAHPQSLVTGNDLINYLDIKPSPQIGYLLTEIQIAHIEGNIFTSKDALEFAKSQLIKLNQS